MAQTTAAGSSMHSPTTPILLFDAKCDMCSRLARKIRSQATGTVELLALSDPEAQELLDEHYPAGWSHDFYLLEGNVARKGVRALPKIASLVGVRNFSTLATEYGRYLVQSEECGEDHAEPQTETARSRGRNATRRTFGKLLGGAAGSALLPLSGLASADSNTTSSVKDEIPDDLRVNVARVRPDGNGGFAADIGSDQSLIRRDVWNDGPSAQNKSEIETREVDESEIVKRSGSTVQKVDLEINSPDASPEHEEALRQSGSDDSAVGAMRRYGLQLDRPRNTLSLNTGYGPVVVDGKPTVQGTLSGEISHDLAEPVVDFITLETEDEASMEAHIEAYIAGLNAYSDYYAARSAEKFAQTYASLAEQLKQVGPEFLSSLDDDIAPIQNTLAISSLPSWTYYVESPSASSGSHQDVTTTGTSCNCSCCPAGCCSGCDCGCSACVGIPPISCGCDCCVVGCGAGCGCGCCYCP